MSEYGLVEPFDNDDIQFCLGVEWEMFRQELLAKDGPFFRQVHTANVARLRRMADRHGRFNETYFYPRPYHEWAVMRIGGAK